MITKIKTKEDIREVFAFMAKMHRVRLGKYEPVATDTPEEAANRSQWGGHMVWREQVALELFNEIRKFDDHEAAVEMVENHASLGVKLTRTVAKQAFSTRTLDLLSTSIACTKRCAKVTARKTSPWLR